jgi:hypothetical protein
MDKRYTLHLYFAALFVCKEYFNTHEL